MRGAWPRNAAASLVRYRIRPMPSDPTYLRALKEYTKSLPDHAQRDAMEQEFYGPSDRACGILFASWVELLVERAIKYRLKPNASPALFDYDGPLGTFSHKISMAYGLGLFGQKTNHDLLLIRTLRNEFAHCQLPLHFEIPEVKSLCDHLMLPDIEGVRTVPQYIYGLPDDRPGFWYDRDHPKTRFVICCYTIVDGLFQLYQMGLLPQVPSTLP
jgi:hypothetical protein